MGAHSQHSSLQFTDAGARSVYQCLEGGGNEIESSRAKPQLGKRDATVSVQGFNLHNQSRQEAADKSGTAPCNGPRVCIRRKHDSTAARCDRIKCVQALRLRRILVAEEVNVVYHQQIMFALATPNGVDRTVPDGCNELIGELLASDAADACAGRALLEAMTQCLAQMRFSHAACAMQKKHLWCICRAFCHPYGAIKRQAITAADQKVVEALPC